MFVIACAPFVVVVFWVYGLGMAWEGMMLILGVCVDGLTS